MTGRDSKSIIVVVAVAMLVLLAFVSIGRGTGQKKKRGADTFANTLVFGEEETDGSNIGNGKNHHGANSKSNSRHPILVIHCFAFNRPHHFKKLWEGLIHAKPSGVRTKIVIHVDFDPSQSQEWHEQVRIALQLSGTETVHGPVTCIFASSPRGLKATMLEAWAPVAGEYAMFLEDDIEVSEMLLVYAEKFIMAYGEGSQRDPTVLGYKLYNQKWDEVNQRYEKVVDNGYAPYKIQEPCSWGTVFVAEPYKRYLSWYMRNYDRDPLIPHAWSNTWDAVKSAKKYMQRFMWEEGLFLIAINFPRKLSLTTPTFSSSSSSLYEQQLAKQWNVPLLSNAEGDESSAMWILPSATSTLRMFGFDRTELFVMQKFSPAKILSLPALRNRLFEGIDEELEMKLYDENFSCNFRWSFIEKAYMRNYVMELGWKGDLSVLVSGDAMCVLLRSLLSEELSRSIMVIKVEWGLGSRLRVLSSALLLARATMRWLVVLWIPDEHCAAAITDVIDVTALGAGISFFNSSVHINNIIDSEKSKWEVLDGFDGVTENKYDFQQAKHLCISSQKSLNVAKQWTYSADNVLLRQLLLHASAAVKELVNSLREEYSLSSWKDVIGLHIRMRLDVFKEIAVEDTRMLQAVPFRLSCDWRHFETIISKQKKHSQKIFLASDSHEAMRGFEFAFPKAVVSFGVCDTRNITCVQQAMASLFILSETQTMYGSKWSAMSEVAIRAGNHKFQFGCELPDDTAWQIGGDQNLLMKQVAAYLSSHATDMAYLSFSVKDVLEAFASRKL